MQQLQPCKSHSVVPSVPRIGEMAVGPRVDILVEAPEADERQGSGDMPLLIGTVSFDLRLLRTVQFSLQAAWRYLIMKRIAILTLVSISLSRPFNFELEQQEIVRLFDQQYIMSSPGGRRSMKHLLYDLSLASTRRGWLAESRLLVWRATTEWVISQIGYRGWW